MSSAIHRLRPLLISLIVLILTAGIAFAGKPSTPADGLAVASEASGKTVPVQAWQGDEDGPEDVDTEEAKTDENEDADALDEDAGDGGDHCATDPTKASVEELAALNHGAIVCWAAHQATPDEYQNHGAWVSEWARQNHGAEDAAARSGDNGNHGKPDKP